MTLAVFETMQLFSPLSFSPASEEEQTGVEDKCQSQKSEVLPKKSESQEQKSDSQGEKSSCPKVKSPRPKFLSRASRISSLLGRSFSFCFLFLLLLIPLLPPPCPPLPPPCPPTHLPPPPYCPGLETLPAALKMRPSPQPQEVKCKVIHCKNFLADPPAHWLCEAIKHRYFN